VFNHAGAPRFVVASRADGTHVKRVAAHGFKQGEIVELGVVGERDDTGASVHVECFHHVVGHARFQRHARHAPAATVFFARVAHGHGKAAEQGHGGQVFGELSCANQQHAVLWTETVAQGGAVVA